MNPPHLVLPGLLLLMLTTLTSCGICCALRKQDAGRLATSDAKAAGLIARKEFVRVRSKPPGGTKDMPPFEVWAFVTPGSTQPDPTKPPVIVLHEVLGLSPDNVVLGSHLREQFAVYMPVFFGKVPERDKWRFFKILLPSTCADFVKNPDKFNAAMSWLEEFSAEISRAHGGGKVGIIGQCASGAMPLNASRFPDIGAAVICQPTFPGYILRKEPARRLGLPPGGEQPLLAALKAKDARLMGVRFQHDPFSPPEVFTNLRRWFGDRFIAHQIDSADYAAGPDEAPRPDLPRCSHSVFSEGDLASKQHPSRRALDAMIRYLDESLR